MEEICQSFIESEGLYNIKSSNSQKEFRAAVVDDLKKKFRFLQPNAGLPFLMAYVSIKATGQLKKLIGIFINLTSNVNKQNSQKGINILRNHCFLAHDNKSITKEVIDKEFPNLLNGEEWLKQIFAICNLPDKNIYTQMNDEIIDLIYCE
jgi:hypothetical protein